MATRADTLSRMPSDRRRMPRSNTEVVTCTVRGQRSLPVIRSKTTVFKGMNRAWLPTSRRQLDVSTDRRIVNHLRRKLNRRLERRANLQANNDRGEKDKQTSKRSTPRLGSPVDPFSSYTDFGDKITKRRPLAEAQPPSSDQAHAEGIDAVTSAKGETNILNPNLPLPEIRTDRKRIQDAQNVSDGASSADTDEASDEIIEPYVEPEVDIPPKEVPISPVSTPLLFRPETRQVGHLTLRETRIGLLRGDLSVLLNPTTSQIRVYILAASQDFEIERTRLIETKLSKLRSFGRERGYDLHIIDLHWGQHEFTADDHSEANVVKDVVGKIYLEKHGNNFMVFLGQRLGDLLVPTDIPPAQYDVLFSAAEEEEERRLEESKVQAAAEAARKLAAIEKQKERAEAAERAGNTSEASQNGRKMSTFGRRESSVSSRETNRFDTRRESAQVKEQNVTLKLQREASQLMQSRRMANHVDPTLMPVWYKLDENAKPPMYRLQKISSVYKDILSTDVKRRTEAKKQWSIIRNKLSHLLSTVSRQIFDDADTIKRYNTTFTEFELQCVLSRAGPTCSRRFWFQREIEDIRLGASDDKLHEYQDLLPFTSTVDSAKQESLDDWKERLLPDLIDSKNRRRYKIPWHRNGITLSFRDHVNYIDRLCKDFGQVTSHIIDEIAEAEQQVSDIKDDLFLEVEQHVVFCQDKSRMFCGRKSLLSAVKKYLRSTTPYPMVVYGKSGCGKTQLLARAARECRKWINRSDPIIVVRFIGVTSCSTNVRLLLRYLCLQLCEVYNEKKSDLPDDYKGLFNSLTFLLSKSSPQKPVVVFIDSLHSLSDEYSGRNLAWLPNELPPYVRLVVSTVADDSFGCLSSLRRTIPAAYSECFLEIPDMTVSEAMSILDQWLDMAGRRLTKEQRAVLASNYRACSLPLYLRVVYREALTWPSSMPPADVRLGAAVKNVLTVFIGRLEKDHGEPLVRRALGYVTAGRHGVTESEMEDLLSLDDAVMADVMAHHKPSLRRLPSMLWARLRTELAEYLAETKVDDCVTLTWAHRAFREAAVDRYMKSKDKAPSYHKALAEYFSDVWTDRPKPYPGNEAGAPRHTVGQPLYWLTEDPRTESLIRVYNLRRLNELPYHLISSQQMAELKRDCLCNFEFLLAKISGVGLRATLEDFQMALSVATQDADLKLLSDTLHLSTAALSRDPRQLASQIIGRMHDIITRDVPSAPGDPVRYPALKPFFDQARHGSIPALIPSITCLTPPGGVLFDLLSGHTEPITAVCLSADGQKCLTASKDNTLKTWDLRSGRVTKTVAGVGADVIQLGIGGDYAIAVTSETSRLRLWSLKSGDCLKVIDEYEDPATIVMAADGMLLAAFYQGTDVMRVWTMGGRFALIQEVLLSDREETNVHKEHSTVVSTNAYGLLVLHAHRNSCEAYVRNTKRGNIVLTLKAKKSGSITAMACTPEYYVLALKFQYMETHEMYSLALFDNRSGKFIREVRGCVEDDVTQLLVNRIGSHAVAVCASPANNTSDIGVWNLETEEHKHVARHADVSHLGACVDLRYCLTGSRRDSTLKIWNLNSMVNQPGTKGRIKDGLENIVLMTENSRYVIAKSMNNGPIAVWNISKGRCAGKAVHIERGLVNSNDVMLVRNTKVLILTDKGLPSGADNRPAVYQTLLVYDLLQKKYVQKLNNCYITPALPHEYAFLSDEHLMGLSDTRSHLVVWSTSTGRVVYRIKAHLREADKRSRDTAEANNRRQNLCNTARMTPWDRRAETESARYRRHEDEFQVEKQRLDDLHREKENIIEQFRISADLSTVITSHYGHHLCVFDVESQTHIQTLEDRSSMLFLYVSALTHSGSHLVHTNYDEEAKLSYLTLWDARQGYIRKRLRNEKNVVCVDISHDARRVVFGKATNELRIWEPLDRGSDNMRRVKGYPTLDFSGHSQLHILDGGRRAVVYAGDISLWDLDRGIVLGVFTPDMRIQCFTPAMAGRLVVFGIQDTSDIVTLRLMSDEFRSIDKTGSDLFGEASSSDEDDMEMEAQLEKE